MSLSARDLDPAERLEFLTALRTMLARGEVSLGEAIRVLRAAYLGLGRARFARVVGISVSELAKLEGGKANPTVGTLDRVLAPFGMKVGVVSARPEPPSLVPDITPARHAELLDAVRGAVARHSRARRGSRRGPHHPL